MVLCAHRYLYRSAWCSRYRSYLREGYCQRQLQYVWLGVELVHWAGASDRGGDTCTAEAMMSGLLPEANVSCIADAIHDNLERQRLQDLLSLGIGPQCQQVMGASSGT
jgi:hypothetical protein